MDERPTPWTCTPLLHGVRESAALLGLSRAKVYQEIKSGRLASVSAGRKRLIPHEALVGYVELLKTENRSAGAE